MPKVVFTFVLGYISLSHLYRAYVDYMGWSLDFTGPQVSDNRSVIHTNHTKHTNIPWYTTVSLNIITFCALLLSRLGPYDSDKVVYVKKYLIVPGIRSIVVSFRLVIKKVRRSIATIVNYRSTRHFVVQLSQLSILKHIFIIIIIIIIIFFSPIGHHSSVVDHDDA